MAELKRCSRCILPGTFPGIRFDEEGVCNFCSNHKPISVLGEAKLKEILDTEKGKTYDCVVPISGGKDSTYVLYYAVKIRKLKVIAVHYDSGFQSDLAKENMKNTCKTLNVPLVVNKVDYGNHVKMLKEILRMSEYTGSFYGLCVNCETNIRTAAINVARENQIPFILYGSSSFESSKGSRSFRRVKTYLKRIPKKDILKVAFHAIRFCFYSVRQSIHMKVPLRYRFLPISTVPFPNKGIRVIHFFDYVEWDQISKINFLVEKLGWVYPDGHLHRFDCLLHCFANHYWLKEAGISIDGFNYSTMIRENHMKREEATLAERVATESLEKECLKIIQKMGLKDYKMPKI